MNELFDKLKLKNVPFDVTFELTYACNLKCIHCYQDNEASIMPLTTDEVKIAMKHLKDAGCMNLAFTGGEIFLRNDIFELIEEANQLGFALKLFTNGTLLNKNVVEQLSKYSIHLVEISIYASNAELHDSVSKIKNSFEVTINAFKLLKEFNIPTMAKTPIMDINSKDLTNIQDLCKELGVAHSFSAIIYPTINSNKETMKLGMTDEELQRIILADINRAVESGVDKESIRKMVFPNNYVEETCGAATRIANITPIGDVTPCIIMPFKLGNLMSSSMNDIWSKNDKVTNMRSTIKSGYGDECKICDVKESCSKCLALAYLENGEFQKPSRALCNVSRHVKNIVSEMI